MEPEDDIPPEARAWAALMHLSVALPGLNLVLPATIWALKKDEFPAIRRHAAHIANWVITLLFAVVAALMVASVLGGTADETVYNGLLWFWIAVVAAIYALVGSLKAASGHTWKAPLAFSFIEPDPPSSRRPPGP